MMQSALHILNHTYGYADFRLNQRDIIDSVLQGQHTLALMPALNFPMPL
jgi:ATP-dependent DNA helicase RecQ